MEYEIGTDVAYQLKDQPVKGQTHYGEIVDIVGKHYVIEDKHGDLIQVTESEVVTAMDTDRA